MSAKGFIAFKPLLICFLLYALSHGQERSGDFGTIRGIVLNPVFGTPLVGATVLVQGTNLSALTGPNGGYMIQAPAGIYSLRMRIVGYDVQTRDSIIVYPNEITLLNFDYQDPRYTYQYSGGIIFPATGERLNVSFDLNNDSPVRRYVVDDASSCLDGCVFTPGHSDSLIYFDIEPEKCVSSFQRIIVKCQGTYELSTTMDSTYIFAAYLHSPVFTSLYELEEYFRDSVETRRALLIESELFDEYRIRLDSSTPWSGMLCFDDWSVYELSINERSSLIANTMGECLYLHSRDLEFDYNHMLIYPITGIDTPGLNVIHDIFVEYRRSGDVTGNIYWKPDGPSGEYEFLGECHFTEP